MINSRLHGEVYAAIIWVVMSQITGVQETSFVSQDTPILFTKEHAPFGQVDDDCIWNMSKHDF